MRHDTRPARPLRTALLAAAAGIALVLALPATSTYAAWRAQSPVGGTPATGALAIDAVAAGSWQHEGGAAFDPATGRLEAGRAVLYRTTVDVTAIGENLRATLVTDVDAAVPADLAGRITVTSDDVAVAGAPTPQRVPVTVRVAAGSLPAGERSFGLRLDLRLTNGHGWQDAASHDLGTLTTRGPAATGRLRLLFDLTKGTDRTVALHVDDARATIQWNEGQGATALVDGRNVHTYPPGATSVTALVVGHVGSLGSPAQTVADMQELVQVQNWEEAVGTTDASYAFHNAVNLQRVDGVPSTLRTTDHMFSNARSLRQDFAGQGMFSRVESMSHMFAGATSFTGYVGGWDTSNVRDMSGMFAGATSFNSYVGGWDTSNVRDMTDMFRGARAMSQSVAGWDVTQVTAWSGFNTDAPGLTTYLIPPRFRAPAADVAADDLLADDAAEPVLPVEPVDPTDPTDPTGPADPADPADAPDDLQDAPRPDAALVAVPRDEETDR